MNFPKFLLGVVACTYCPVTLEIELWNGVDSVPVGWYHSCHRWLSCLAICNLAQGEEPKYWDLT